MYGRRQTPMVSLDLHNRKSEADPERWRMPAPVRWDQPRQPCTLGWTLSRRTAGEESYFSRVGEAGDLLVEKAKSESNPILSNGGLPYAGTAHMHACPLCPDYLEAAAVDPEQRDAVKAVCEFFYEIGESIRQEEQTIASIQYRRAELQKHLEFLDAAEEAAKNAPAYGGLRTAYYMQDLRSAINYVSPLSRLVALYDRWFNPGRES